MNLLVKEPKTTEFCFQSEDGDALCSNCMWINFLLNHDTYVLSITSDCGFFSYGWKVTESEPFINLMARIDKEYLLNKISSMSRIDLGESKRKTIENVESSFAFQILPKLQRESIISDIDEIESNSEEGFYRCVESILYAGISTEDIEIEMTYPRRAIIVCEIFEKYLQPKLKQLIGTINIFQNGNSSN